jgi:hypothetical protein
MHIDINDNTRLREIQEVFPDYYPYLGLAFYKKHEASPEQELITAEKTIGELKQTHVSGLLEMMPFYKVADIEKEFGQRFDLSVQILRKEKDGWVQTTGMDDFTLKELNELGRNSSDEFIVEDYNDGFI